MRELNGSCIAWARNAAFAAAAALTLGLAAPAAAEGVDPSAISSGENHMCGCGPSCACGSGCGCPDSSVIGPPRLAGVEGFESENVVLLSRISLGDFGAQYTSGNDSWGYTSPSGREYALMGLNSATAFVEITNPRDPVIIATIPHPSSLWSDIKVYGHHAYVVNENFFGGGLQVIDMQGIDDGVVTLANTVTHGGSLRRAHNLVVDEDSGYLYLCGANWPTSGLVAYSLADPANPVYVGAYSSVYVHDAHVVTYTTGPHAGRQIAYCSVGSYGIDIVDVTDKSNMFRVSRTTYSDLAYSHQGWVDVERQLFYHGDELDGDSVNVTTTRVFDVSDLASPQYLGWFTSGVDAIDHNQYLHEGFLFQANYRSGLRIFDTRDDPVSPPQTGWFDTYPDGLGTFFNGAWSNYPYFPSGTVIVSDIEGGLFVLDPTFALNGGVPLAVSYPDGLPVAVAAEGASLRVRIEGVNGRSVVPGSGVLVVTGDGHTATIPLVPTGGDEYTANFPKLGCVSEVTFYVAADADNGLTVNDPLHAPTLEHAASVTPARAGGSHAGPRSGAAGPVGFVCAVPGDIDGDGVVDFADMSIVLNQFGLSGPSLPGDVNGDGAVDFADLNIILSNYGANAW